MDFKTGQVVRSLAGRDRSRHYVVVAVHDNRVLVADGAKRPLTRLKPKNPQHLVFSGVYIDSANMNDDSIRQILRTLTAEQSQLSNQGEEEADG